MQCDGSLGLGMLFLVGPREGETTLDAFSPTAGAADATELYKIQDCCKVP